MKLKTYLNGTIGIIVVIGSLFFYWNANILVDKMKAEQMRKLNFWVKSIEVVIASEDVNNVSFLFNEVVATIDFPVILTDEHNNPITYRNIQLDSSISEKVKTAILEKRIERMDKKYSPIKIVLEKKIFQYVHYEDAEYIRYLEMAPYIIGVIVAILILLVYWSFRINQHRDQEKIWVGMAKETAHQLGTPISAIMGWSELLKLDNVPYEEQINIAKEIDKDLDRLKIITTRFSKIGSKEILKPHSVHTIITSVFDYFEKRLPRIGKKITLHIEGNKNIYAYLNVELMEWVFENMVRNAIDAMDKQEGSIIAKLHHNHHYVFIDIQDTGKGISSKHKRKIFKAGFTTKERGWGLGLALVKRIVENHHQGKIQILKTEVGSGTTFQIQLNLATAENGFFSTSTPNIESL